MVDPKTVDHRADLYALGIILFEMLEGGVPFTADSPFRVIEMHMRQPLPTRENSPTHPAVVWHHNGFAKKNHRHATPQQRPRLCSWN